MNKKEVEECKTCKRTFAIETNRIVWDLLLKKKRGKEEDEMMIHAAHASYFHWSRAGTAINLQRGAWLLSHVYAVLNIPERALFYAEKCMALTEENGFKDFDLAYAYEALARAYAASNDEKLCKKYMALAQDAAKLIKDSEDRKLFESDLKSSPWFGCGEFGRV